MREKGKEEGAEGNIMCVGDWVSINPLLSFLLPIFFRQKILLSVFSKKSHNENLKEQER